LLLTKNPVTNVIGFTTTASAVLTTADEAAEDKVVNADEAACIFLSLSLGQGCLFNSNRFLSLCAFSTDCVERTGRIIDLHVDMARAFRFKLNEA
jgi:hypothetical protein